MLNKKLTGGLIILAVYVDDIILTKSEDTCILVTIRVSKNPAENSTMRMERAQ